MRSLGPRSEQLGAVVSFREQEQNRESANIMTRNQGLRLPSLSPSSAGIVVKEQLE